MLSQERKDALMGIIKNNQKLLMLEPDEAVEEIKKLGHGFTLNELKEFAKEMEISGELSIESLEDIAGGLGAINIICTSW